MPDLVTTTKSPTQEAIEIAERIVERLKSAYNLREASVDKDGLSMFGGSYKIDNEKKTEAFILGCGILAEKEESTACSLARLMIDRLVPSIVVVVPTPAAPPPDSSGHSPPAAPTPAAPPPGSSGHSPPAAPEPVAPKPAGIAKPPTKGPTKTVVATDTEELIPVEA